MPSYKKTKTNRTKSLKISQFLAKDSKQTKNKTSKTLSKVSKLVAKHKLTTNLKPNKSRLQLQLQLKLVMKL
jgi:hypothetical protein